MIVWLAKLNTNVTDFKCWMTQCGTLNNTFQQKKLHKYQPLTRASCNLTQFGVVLWKEVKNGIIHALQATPVLQYMLFTDDLHTSLHQRLWDVNC